MKDFNSKPSLSIFNRVDKIAFSVIGILTILAIVFWSTVKTEKKAKSEPKIVKAGNDSGKDIATTKKNEETTYSQVSITKKWDMPIDLKEISGLSFMDDERFVCVQDELGTVFVFNSTSNKIEKKISFAKKGDFEGIAFINDNLVYVVRADGKLFEVVMEKAETSAKEYSTSLTIKHNVEGLCYDKDNNRLLLAIKDADPNFPDFKGIYAFDLANKTFLREPVFKINLNDDAFKGLKKKSVMPSAIAIHPTTDDIYITDGPNARLLILDKEGKIKRLLDLGKDFSQPEGITFGTNENIFISNEGTKRPGNILMIDIH